MCFRPATVDKRAPITCPKCGFVNRPGSKTCKECKQDLFVTDCPECGVPQPTSALVCKNCGYNGKPGSGDPAKRKA
ncbi:MAG: zinc ribbon domain-containing protein [Sporomusaceae bacterium]|jgi:ribosomal protein L40E|nr:zinc ribbon domain-containing protein [Sporomusaceae bacterium]